MSEIDDETERLLLMTTGQLVQSSATVELCAKALLAGLFTEIDNAFVVVSTLMHSQVLDRLEAVGHIDPQKYVGLAEWAKNASTLNRERNKVIHQPLGLLDEERAAGDHRLDWGS